MVIRPRVYSRGSYAILHKAVLCFKTILAPEFIAVEGFQEWAQCKRMQKDCDGLTDKRFKPIHAFYISMLALRYRTPDGDRVIWPNQYTWLLQQRLVSWETHKSWGLSEEYIRDKSKTDGLAKLIALVQVTWFVAQCIMRAAHSLPISQLESMTLGYIPLFIVTYFFWWNKPKDIGSPSIIDLPDMHPEQRYIFESMAVSNKFGNEGMKNEVTYWNVWYLTPRVFEKEEEDKVIRHARAKAAEKAAQRAAERATKNQNEDSELGILHETTEDLQMQLRKNNAVARWDPYLFRSRLWPLTCLFGISFGALPSRNMEYCFSYDY